MSLRELRIDTTDRYPIKLVRLEGHLVGLEVYKLKNHMEKMIDAGSRYFVLDLEGLIFLDSAGLGALSQLRGLCQRNNGHLTLAGLDNPSIAQIFHQRSMETAFDLQPDAQSAVLRIRRLYNLPHEASQTGSDQPTESHMIYSLMQELDILARQVSRVDRRLDEVERWLEQIQHAQCQHSEQPDS